MALQERIHHGMELYVSSIVLDYCNKHGGAAGMARGP